MLIISCLKSIGRKFQIYTSLTVTVLYLSSRLSLCRVKCRNPLPFFSWFILLFLLDHWKTSLMVVKFLSIMKFWILEWLKAYQHAYQNSRCATTNLSIWWKKHNLKMMAKANKLVLYGHLSVIKYFLTCFTVASNVVSVWSV